MVIIVLTIVLAYVSTGVQSSCSTEDVKVCVTPFLDVIKSFGKNISSTTFIIFQLNDDQLNEYCSADQQMASCYNQLQDCGESVTNAVEDLSKFVQFLCTDTLEELKSYRRCYTEKAVINRMQSCMELISQIINFPNYDVYEKGIKFCGIVNKTYSCIRNVVEPECGKKAADWEINYLMKAYATKLGLVSCDDVENHCTDTFVEGCRDLLTDFRRNTGIKDEFYLYYFPIYLLNNDQLYHYCRTFQKVNSCYKSHNCTKSILWIYGPEQVPMKFLCTDTLEEYKTYKRCYDEAPSVSSGLQHCSKKIFYDFRRIDWFKLHVGDNMNTTCGKVSETYSCIRGAIEPECGKKAADWEIAYMKKSTVYTDDDFLKCKDESRKGFPIWAICVTVAGVISFVVCATVVIKCVVARKKKIADGSATQFNNVLAF